MGRPGTPVAVARRHALVATLLPARGLVVVSAPAGYGKTTATACWDDADERMFAWVRLDHLDDDPAHLLLHLAMSVDRVARLDPGVLGYLSGPGRDPLAQLVPAVAHALERRGPLVVVLDDVHEVTAPASVDVLRALIEVIPSTTTMALLGRCPPPLDLTRHRLGRTVVEIGVEQLRLSDDEALAVFRAAGGQHDGVAAREVLDRCEGWAAGVALAGMAMRDGVGIPTGRHHLVSDYLVEEVLSRLDAGMARFLHESAVLDRFCAEQLDVVLDRDDSAVMLGAAVESGNLFLIPLDPERVWFRYHRMFGDLLRARLRARDPHRFRTLAGRAADVLERDGDIDGALVQALAADDRARAAELVGRDAVKLGFDGRAGVLARRVGLLDERTFAEQPDAAIARAWLGVTVGDAGMIQRSLLLAHQGDRGGPLADGTPSVAVAAALVGSLVGVGGVREVVRHADTVRAAGDHLVNPWWGAATVMKGAALSMLGELAPSRMLLESALPVVERLPGFHAAALAHLALLDLGDGDDVAAAQRSAAARAIVDTSDLCDLVPMVVVYAVSAVMAARVGDDSGARSAVAATDRLLDRLGALAARTALLGHSLLAWTAAVLQDAELLTHHLAAADRARKREPDAAGLWRRVEQVRAMSSGRQRHPLTAAELRLLPYLATHLSLQRIAEELMIGRETAKTQATSIYRKLAVSSREAAVVEAERLGLLSR